MKTVLQYTKLITALLIWSFSYIWTSQCLEYINPITLVFLRLGISSIFLYSVAKLLRKFRRMKSDTLKTMFALAIFEPFLYFLCESYGLSYVTPTIAAVILATLPLFTPFAAYLFLNEKIKILNVIGIFISFSGLLLIIVNPNAKIDYSLIGLGLMFLAVFSAVVYSIICTKLLRKNNAYTVVTYQNSIGGLYFLPLFLLIEFPTLDITVFDSKLIGLLLLLSFFASTVAFIFYIDSIRVLGIVKVNAMLNSLPMITAVLSYFIYDEVLDSRKILGIIIVILGVVLSQSNINYSKIRNYLSKQY